MSSKIAMLAAGAALTLACGVGSNVGAQSITEWLDAPTVADFQAAYPARAKAQNVSGFVRLTCEVGRDKHPRDCEAVTEKPSGYGFAVAAQKLAAKIVIGDTDIVHQNVFIPFTFDASVVNGQASLTKPSWAALPSAEDFNATFPKTENGVNHVRVVLGCTVAAGGALNDCAVAQEDPPGQGYGQGALALAPKFRVSLWGSEGQPAVGAHINLPIRYELAPVKK